MLVADFTISLHPLIVQYKVGVNHPPKEKMSSLFGMMRLEKLFSPLPAGTPLPITEDAACSQVDPEPIVQSITDLLSKLHFVELALEVTDHIG